MNTSVTRVLRMMATLAALPAMTIAQVKVEAGVRAAPDCAIRLQGPIATIRVTGWDRDSIAVIGSIPKGARFDRFFGNEAGTAVRGVKMFVEGTPGQIRPAGIIELRVPTGARVVLHSGSAEIEVTGLTNEVDIEMLGGSARVTASPRVLTIDAINATITVDGSPERVQLNSAEGDITMRGGSLNAEFSTVSGNIRVGGGTYDRARFDATTGLIAFSGELARNARFAISTHSAAVDLYLSPKASAVIDATTSLGTIENAVSKSAPVPGPEGKGQRLSTEIGKPTATIEIGTYKGDIRLLRRSD
jgi:hypothetical protein